MHGNSSTPVTALPAAARVPGPRSPPPHQPQLTLLPQREEFSVAKDAVGLVGQLAEQFGEVCSRLYTEVETPAASPAEEPCSRPNVVGFIDTLARETERCDALLKACLTQLSLQVSSLTEDSRTLSETYPALAQTLGASLSSPLLRSPYSQYGSPPVQPHSISGSLSLPRGAIGPVVGGSGDVAVGASTPQRPSATGASATVTSSGGNTLSGLYRPSPPTTATAAAATMARTAASPSSPHTPYHTSAGAGGGHATHSASFFYSPSSSSPSQHPQHQQQQQQPPSQPGLPPVGATAKTELSGIPVPPPKREEQWDSELKRYLAQYARWTPFVLPRDDSTQADRREDAEAQEEQNSTVPAQRRRQQPRAKRRRPSASYEEDGRDAATDEADRAPMGLEEVEVRTRGSRVRSPSPAFANVGTPTPQSVSEAVPPPIAEASSTAAAAPFATDTPSFTRVFRPTLRETVDTLVLQQLQYDGIPLSAEMIRELGGEPNEALEESENEEESAAGYTSSSHRMAQRTEAWAAPSSPLRSASTHSRKRDSRRVSSHDAEQCDALGLFHSRLYASPASRNAMLCEVRHGVHAPPSGPLPSAYSACEEGAAGGVPRHGHKVGTTAAATPATVMTADAASPLSTISDRLVQRSFPQTTRWLRAVIEAATERAAQLDAAAMEAYEEAARRAVEEEERVAARERRGRHTQGVVPRPRTAPRVVEPVQRSPPRENPITFEFGLRVVDTPHEEDDDNDEHGDDDSTTSSIATSEEERVGGEEAEEEEEEAMEEEEVEIEDAETGPGWRWRWERREEGGEETERAHPPRRRVAPGVGQHGQQMSQNIRSPRDVSGAAQTRSSSLPASYQASSDEVLEFSSVSAGVEEEEEEHPSLAHPARGPIPSVTPGLHQDSDSDSDSNVAATPTTSDTSAEGGDEGERVEGNSPALRPVAPPAGGGDTAVITDSPARAGEGTASREEVNRSFFSQIPSAFRVSSEPPPSQGVTATHERNDADDDVVREHSARRQQRQQQQRGGDEEGDEDVDLYHDQRQHHYHPPHGEFAASTERSDIQTPSAFLEHVPTPVVAALDQPSYHGESDGLDDDNDAGRRDREYGDGNRRHPPPRGGRSLASLPPPPPAQEDVDVNAERWGAVEATGRSVLSSPVSPQHSALTDLAVRAQVLLDDLTLLCALQEVTSIVMDTIVSTPPVSWSTFASKDALSQVLLAATEFIVSLQDDEAFQRRLQEFNAATRPRDVAAAVTRDALGVFSDTDAFASSAALPPASPTAAAAVGGRQSGESPSSRRAHPTAQKKFAESPVTVQPQLLLSYEHVLEALGYLPLMLFAEDEGDANSERATAAEDGAEAAGGKRETPVTAVVKGGKKSRKVTAADTKDGAGMHQPSTGSSSSSASSTAAAAAKFVQCVAPFLQLWGLPVIASAAAGGPGEALQASPTLLRMVDPHSASPVLRTSLMPHILSLFRPHPNHPRSTRAAGNDGEDCQPLPASVAALAWCESVCDALLSELNELHRRCALLYAAETHDLVVKESLGEWCRRTGGSVPGLLPSQGPADVAMVDPVLSQPSNALRRFVYPLSHTLLTKLSGLVQHGLLPVPDGDAGNDEEWEAERLGLLLSLGAAPEDVCAELGSGDDDEEGRDGGGGGGRQHATTLPSPQGDPFVLPPAALATNPRSGEEGEGEDAALSQLTAMLHQLPSPSSLRAHLRRARVGDNNNNNNEEEEEEGDADVVEVSAGGMLAGRSGAPPSVDRLQFLAHPQHTVAPPHTVTPGHRTAPRAVGRSDPPHTTPTRGPDSWLERLGGRWREAGVVDAQVPTAVDVEDSPTGQAPPGEDDGIEEYRAYAAEPSPVTEGTTAPVGAEEPPARVRFHRLDTVAAGRPRSGQQRGNLPAFVPARGGLYEARRRVVQAMLGMPPSPVRAGPRDSGTADTASLRGRRMVILSASATLRGGGGVRGGEGSSPTGRTDNTHSPAAVGGPRAGRAARPTAAVLDLPHANEVLTRLDEFVARSTRGRAAVYLALPHRFHLMNACDELALTVRACAGDRAFATSSSTLLVPDSSRVTAAVSEPADGLPRWSAADYRLLLRCRPVFCGNMCYCLVSRNRCLDPLVYGALLAGGDVVPETDTTNREQRRVPEGAAVRDHVQLIVRPRPTAAATSPQPNSRGPVAEGGRGGTATAGTNRATQMMRPMMGRRVLEELELLGPRSAPELQDVVQLFSEFPTPWLGRMGRPLGESGMLNVVHRALSGVDVPMQPVVVEDPRHNVVTTAEARETIGVTHFLTSNLTHPALASTALRLNPPNRLRCGHVVSQRTLMNLLVEPNRRTIRRGTQGLSIVCPYCEQETPTGEVVTLSYMY